jgi:hypothetical protein
MGGLHTLFSVSVRGPLNAFGYLLVKHCERHGVSLRELTRLAALTSTSRIYYAIRAATGKGRSTPLSEDELVRVSRALKLDVEGAEELVITALLESAPLRLQKYVRRLEALKVQQPKQG